MKINTGKGYISLMTLIAIWSISLTVNLPGLAITPMLGNLDKIFPHTSELEIQLLTVLPNLFIIPFVLLSGKLSLSKSKISIVVIALAIYLAGGILYLFADSMVELIVISCILGMGCGLLIPLAAGLIADTFVGKYRMQQLGIKSGISNMALVIATFIVGWLNRGNWHLPFLVYLIPAIPLALSVFLRGIPAADINPPAVTPSPQIKASVKVATAATVAGTPAKAIHAVPPTPLSDSYGTIGKVKDGFIISRLWALMGVYFFVCYATVIVSYYSPFLMQSEGMSDSEVGTVTSIFFLAIFLPGFILPYVVRLFKQSTLIVSSLVMSVGVILMIIGSHFGIMCLASTLIGFGYGVFQPLIYDKATQVITSPSKATLALAFVLAANYVSISATPFVVDFFRMIFDPHHMANRFPFILNSILLVAFTVVVFICRRSFVFRIDKSYY
ncbi:MFS transporter [uncultured Muribaculum sp.]|uniref:MFS transporter n=1 Tax=uncultured Muribaculum sp. TaxID=1918613 RepID=UPI0025FDFA17|nr:MFS transporter [uncultured Muribaculum sp.]